MSRGLTVHEVGEVVGRSPATLRRYEREGRIPRASRDLSGWRRFSFADIAHIQNIIDKVDDRDTTPQK